MFILIGRENRFRLFNNTSDGLDIYEESRAFSNQRAVAVDIFLKRDFSNVVIARDVLRVIPHRL